MKVKDIRVGTVVECVKSGNMVFRDPEYQGTKGVPSVVLRPGQKAVCYYKSYVLANHYGHVTRWVTIPEDTATNGRRFEIDCSRYYESHRGLERPL